ncbi:hypothetical protein Hanom_Chr06g00540121 [Helianthus anomalus]
MPFHKLIYAGFLQHQNSTICCFRSAFLPQYFQENAMQPVFQINTYLKEKGIIAIYF